MQKKRPSSISLVTSIQIWEMQNIQGLPLSIAGAVPTQAGKKITTILQPTVIEAYGRAINDYAIEAKQNPNVKGLSPLDLRTPKADEHYWDFCGQIQSA